MLVGRRAAGPGLTLPPLKHLGPLLVVWGAAMLMLVFIRDLGSSLMFFGAFLALLYVATDARSRSCSIGLVMFVVGAYFFARAPSATSRTAFDIWLDPFAATPRRRRLPGAAVAVRPGRRRAVRAGARRVAAQAAGPFAPDCEQPFPDCGSILPAPHTDFIYAVIVNELGLFGACGVILIYALIAARGFKTAVMAPDGFSKLLAAGLTAVFALQAFVIIGGVTG